MYQVLKDFAGPVATIIAATVAVFVTWRLGRGQLRIAQQQAVTARQQANTALERLKLDLYDKRFNIYAAVLDLNEAVFHKTLADIEAAGFIVLRAFRESMFIFESKDGVYDTLKEINDAYVHIRNSERETVKNPILLDQASEERISMEPLIKKLEQQLIKYLDFSKI